jgi:hypothetical protein
MECIYAPCHCCPPVFSKIKGGADMSLETETADLQFLETGLQTPPPSFFRSQFLETISKNQFLRNYNGSKHALSLVKKTRFN